jgi:oxepin-CoA hydrolase/3-oxo-5,6-dehydrosuberyl-CoA semialdehyde dehydrogenase
MKLKSFLSGQWVEGEGEQELLFDSVTGDLVAVASTKGLDFEHMLRYGRSVGGPALRKLTFHERGRMLKALAQYLGERKQSYYNLSYRTGATRADSWIDIEGGIGNLFSYASLRRQFPDEPFYVDGQAAKLSRTGGFIGQHIMVPRQGVAIHINAYNFPVWGMLEKIAVNLLAGVPAVVKPASPGSFLTEAVFRDIIESGIFPPGSLQLVCGQPGNLLDFVQSQDLVTFTGSAKTGHLLKVHPSIIRETVPFTMEADSLNCCILALDAAPGSADFDVFIREVHREMTVKCGQKCTAIRRILVPEKYLEDVQIALGKRLSKTVIGDPRLEEVRMGALVGRAQLQQLQERIRLLAAQSAIVYGSADTPEVRGADPLKGAFIAPVLLVNEDPLHQRLTHELEAFGPVATLMPYRSPEEAIVIANMGRGSLVSTIVTSDKQTAIDYVMGTSSFHGRILLLNHACAQESTGHGSPLPMLIHGGPGHAGGGEEMGGKRGVLHYLQRTAVQGSATMLTALTRVYQPGGQQQEKETHPFRRHFEELEIGETLLTARHTVTEADITNFANVSGDHFYAHMDATSLEGTIFEGRVAHGYYILSKAAGLFVDAKKGPVLLNYGIDVARFTKPVYPGTTIGVRLTVKEKTNQEKREPGEVAKGIVKWLVDVYDQTGETVAIATILTMVKKLDQS